MTGYPEVIPGQKSSCTKFTRAYFRAVYQLDFGKPRISRLACGPAVPILKHHSRLVIRSRTVAMDVKRRPRLPEAARGTTKVNLAFEVGGFYTPREFGKSTAGHACVQSSTLRRPYERNQR